MATSGILREGVKGAFRYRLANGRPVRDPRTLDRIRRLAIPPAWTDVWIAAATGAHLQATGRDAKGRKQYRYHASWTADRTRDKFDHILDFARVLPAVRRGVSRDLNEPPLSRRRVLATLVTLLEKTHIRVGNAEYTRANGSYGLTTLRNEHVDVKGSRVEFRFTGKSGIDHAITLVDRRLAREVDRCLSLPSHTVFDYMDDDGRVRRLASVDVNRYLGELAALKVTAKDFRTWWATVSAATRLRDAGARPSRRQATRQLNQVLDQVAGELGNTRSICRKSYVHPAIIDAYLDGDVMTSRPTRARAVESLSREEQQVLAWLRTRALRRPLRRAA